MQLDLEKLRAFAYNHHMPLVEREYGSRGVDVLREVMETLRYLYTYVEPELITGALVVFKSLENDLVLDNLPDPEVFSYAEHLAQEYDPSSRKGTALIQISSHGDLLLWKEVTIDLAKLSNNAIVYIYRGRQDHLLIGGNEKEIFNPSKAHASAFSIATFRELKDALENYKRRMVRTSQCKIFAKAWDGGENGDRLFLKNKPESIMRDSLWQFLSSVLGAEVRPEQIVDESHPCDIKVTWMQTNRIALIEIKWLGKSINEVREITQEFSESRAREGAEQLADYLDANKTKAPMHSTRGYLVIIDARRWRLTPTSTCINLRNGLWYRDKEISYNPEYHFHRTDFEKPIRMFAEPKCKPE